MDNVVTIDQVLEHLRRCGATTTARMLAEVRAHKSWQLVDLPSDQMVIRVTSDNRLVRRYRELDQATMPPIVAIPAGLSFRVLDGHHRAAAREQLGLDVPAYIPTF